MWPRAGESALGLRWKRTRGTAWVMQSDPADVLHQEAADRRASFLELFFDLVYVFALARVTTRAFEDLTTDPEVASLSLAVTGAGRSTFLLLALWAVWQGTAWTTSRYDPYRGSVQLVMLTALVAAMVMGVAIPRAFGDRAITFAVAYVVAQISRPLILAIALRGDNRQRQANLRILFTFSVTAVLWLAGALVPQGWLRGLLWAVALGLEYLSARFGWPTPRLGRSTPAKLSIAGEHLADRYQQFFLVALGEAVVVTGLTYSAGRLGLGRTIAFGFALLTAVLIWRIYFYRAGQILAEAVVASRQPARTGRSAADSHVLMVGGVIASAVGSQLVIAQPFEAGPWPWAVVILGGPALFIIGRSRFEYEVFGGVSPSRIVVLAGLVVLYPVLFRLPPLVALLAVAVMLGSAAIADARRARGAPPEPPHPPM